MPFYIVHGDLPEDVKKIAYDLRITDESLLHWPMNETPHVTIMYGPEIDNGEPEILEPERADEVLGGFVEKYRGVLPTFKVLGVSHFTNEKFNVIKIELESQEMTDMQIFLRNSTRNNYKETFEKNKQPSYAMPPVKWCHLTLGYTKKGLPVEPILAHVEKRLQETGIVGSTKKLVGISLVGAVTKKRTKLW